MQAHLHLPPRSRLMKAIPMGEANENDTDDALDLDLGDLGLEVRPSAQEEDDPYAVRPTA